jgi:hypothetical protein
MNVVYKWALKLGHNKVFIPEGAIVLDAQMQHGSPTIWALVNTEVPSRDRFFIAVGTGHPVPDNTKTYIGTMQDGSFVWHVFEVQQ